MLWPSSLWALNLDRSSGPSCVDLGLLTGFAEDGIPYPMSLARLLGTFGLGFLRPIQKSEVPSTEGLILSRSSIYCPIPFPDQSH